MKYSLLFTFLLFISSPFCVSAHQLDFFGKCNKVPLPNCPTNWNSMTSSDSALYVVGDNGTCFISFHNGGIKLIHTGTSTNLTGVQFINNNIGYTWGAQGTLLKTNDAGSTWTAMVTDTSSTIDKVQFVDADHGFFMVGSSISKTINGGTTWTKMILPTAVPITDFHFFDHLNGQICGGKLSPSALGYVYSTKNGGNTWHKIYTDNIYFKKLFYVNDSAAYLYGFNNSNPVLITTVDTGSTWSTTYSNSSWTLGSGVIHFSDQATFITNETGGEYIYGRPEFGTPDGITTGAKCIHSLKSNGVEMLYILSSSGLYRYINGGLIYFNIDFFTGINPNASNPTNTLNPGSKVKFKISIYNVFLSTLINLTGKIRCSSPYITITDSLGAYNNVLSHSFAANKDDFEIQLANNIPNNYVPQFELMMGDPLQAGGTWNSIFSFPIVLSPFTISHVLVDDDSLQNSKGNNNTVAEPSETIEITPISDNTTHHTFTNIEGYLFSEHHEINIWKDTLGYLDTVRNHYPYYTFTDTMQNVQPTETFVFTNNYTDTLKLPLSMIFTGNINTFQVDGSNCYTSDYNTILFRWTTNFSVNDGYPDPVNISELKKNSVKNFTLFPNPNNGKFILKCDIENGKMKIENILGETVFQSIIKHDNLTAIDISEKPTGIYFIEITSDKEKETLKMIKF
jgi:photosystem II stability/assembly factor-like uncharacterized protein